jgi:hypothetical protein
VGIKYVPVPVSGANSGGARKPLGTMLKIRTIAVVLLLPVIFRLLALWHAQFRVIESGEVVGTTESQRQLFEQKEQRVARVRPPAGQTVAPDSVRIYIGVVMVSLKVADIDYYMVELWKPDAVERDV